ncbi:MAG: IclR family transcriptional regulator [Candidatus Acidiferrum sp.]
MRSNMAANNYIEVVEKTLRLLEAFRGEREVRLAELAERTRLVKSSVFRILFTLERLGYVEKGPGGRYSVLSRFARIAGDPAPTFDLGALAAPFMGELLRQFQETVNLGVRDESEVLYIRVLESSHSFRLAAHAGIRSSFHSSALGKCLLCRMSREEVDAILKKNPMRRMTSRTICSRILFHRELEKVRLRGYALDNEEDARGARCVAAPILDSTGKVYAAMSISGPATRVSRTNEREIAEALKEACRQISKLFIYNADALKGSASGAQ